MPHKHLLEADSRHLLARLPSMPSVSVGTMKHKRNVDQIIINYWSRLTCLVAPCLGLCCTCCLFTVGYSYSHLLPLLFYAWGWIFPWDLPLWLVGRSQRKNTVSHSPVHASDMDRGWHQRPADHAVTEVGQVIVPRVLLAVTFHNRTPEELWRICFYLKRPFPQSTLISIQLTCGFF